MNGLLQPLGNFREAGVFFFSLILGLVAIVTIRRFWKWHRGLDAGDGVRKLQKQPVLRVGGLVLYIVFVSAFAFSKSPEESGQLSLLGIPFFLLATSMFILGFVDDLFGLPAILRLAVQIAVGVAAYQCGMRIDIISHPLEGSGIETGGFGLILTVIWFVAIPNLINLVDGMDGLAGGIALFLCLTLAILGGIAGNAELLLLNVALSGGILAFLTFNLPPAKIYMGDGGAYLLGFIIAGASLLSANKGSIFGPLLVVMIVLGFPILDTAFAMVRRGLSGLPVMRPDALHLHHRLIILGFSKRNILFTLYGIFAGLSLLGLSVFVSRGYTLPVVGMVLVIGVVHGLRFIGLPHNLSEMKKVLDEVVSARKDVRYAYSMSQVLEHDLERFATAEHFWKALRRFLSRLQVRPTSPEGLGECLAEGCRLVVLRLDDATIWALCCPVTEGSGRRWERVARCFYPAIMGARARWGAELPAALGFFDADESGRFAGTGDRDSVSCSLLDHEGGRVHLGSPGVTEKVPRSGI
jgi:UDP-GlcNAc:undecaprenyl-phosphate GlcNAc-1-phosphate transferase